MTRQVDVKLLPPALVPKTGNERPLNAMSSVFIALVWYMLTN